MEVVAGLFFHIVLYNRVEHIGGEGGGTTVGLLVSKHWLLIGLSLWSGDRWIWACRSSVNCKWIKKERNIFLMKLFKIRPIRFQVNFHFMPTSLKHLSITIYLEKKEFIFVCYAEEIKSNLKWQWDDTIMRHYGKIIFGCFLFYFIKCEPGPQNQSQGSILRCIHNLKAE